MYCAPRLLKENPERFQIIDYIFHLAMATKCDTISSSGFKIQYGVSEVLCARDHVLFYLFLCACTFPALNICLYISYFSLIGTPISCSAFSFSLFTDINTSCISHSVSFFLISLFLLLLYRLGSSLLLLSFQYLIIIFVRGIHVILLSRL